MHVALVALAVALLIPGCSDRTSPPPAAESTRSRRVFEKPPGGPRAVPPHAIRSEGVGPYLLGMPLKDVLGLTSRGPSVMLMELDGMVDYSLVRAENDTVIVGVERGAGVAFVTVVDREIARTDKGLGVGAKQPELEEALGPRRQSAGRLFDPRIATFERLPNARFVLDGGVAIAVTLGKRDRPVPVPEGEASAPPRAEQAGPRARCGADALRTEIEAIVAAARVEPSADEPIQLTFGCLDANDPLVVATTGDRMAIVTGTADRLRRLRGDSVDGLVFAGPIDIGGDGSDEIVVVTQSSSPEGKSWRVDVHRGDARMTRLASRSVYHLAAASVPWIGATLSEVDLLLAFEVEEETLHVGGLLLQRDGDRVKVVAPLINKRLVVRSRAGSGGAGGDEDEIDAGIPDARHRGGKPDAGVLKRPKR